MKKCGEAGPKQGNLWTQISKDIKNWRMTPPEILVTASEFVDFN